jgi:hypothetical protein
LQANYNAFISALTRDRRFDWAEAASTVPVLVKTCMTHKLSITLPGQNIRLDIIPNEVAAACLTLISDLLGEEARQFAPN